MRLQCRISRARWLGGMSVRALTPAQNRENAAFLAELRRTGNAREAARRLGAHRAKFTKRRAKHPGFAMQWAAALASAQERLARCDPFEPGLTHLSDGRLQLRPPRASPIDPDRRLEFLAMLSLTGSARFAAEALGFSHAAFYHYKERDPDFAKAWHIALYGGDLRWKEE
jgi:hypothetical protein